MVEKPVCEVQGSRMMYYLLMSIKCVSVLNDVTQKFHQCLFSPSYKSALCINI